MTAGGAEPRSDPNYYFQQQQQQQQQQPQPSPPPPPAAPPSYYGTVSQDPHFPQPVPPPPYPPSSSSSIHPYLHPGFVEGRPAGSPYQPREPLPFCGLGVGWFLFILGFVCISISWWVGAFIFFCLKHDPRERVGLAACTIAAIIALIAGTKFYHVR